MLIGLVEAEPIVVFKEYIVKNKWVYHDPVVLNCPNIEKDGNLGSTMICSASSCTSLSPTIKWVSLNR